MYPRLSVSLRLFQIPQRYRFSSKSQLSGKSLSAWTSCFRYHKGTDFQANHNRAGSTNQDDYVVLDTTKVQIFKQITTEELFTYGRKSCFRYHKGTDFQANHNKERKAVNVRVVVLDTTKVQIFKQITTEELFTYGRKMLFQIPQRYRFSSKSQQWLAEKANFDCCFRYHKGTDFQANHNELALLHTDRQVVLDTTKVQIFKQITT